MAGRAYVNRQVQVGVETTHGTAVAANKSLPSASIELTRELDVKEYRALGHKVMTVTKVTRDWCSGKLSGPLNYSEIVYPLSTLVAPVITTPANGVLTRKWVFTAADQGEDTFKSLTIQEGDSTAAQQAAFAVFTEFGADIKEDDATMDGTLLAQGLAAGSLTSSPTSIAQLPIGPREIDVYMDAIGGTIGTTKVTDALSASFKISNKYGPKWVLNTANTAWKETVEMPLTMTGSIVTEHNAQSRAFYAAISNTANPYYLIRLQATGSLIESVTPDYYYKLQIDFAAQVVKTQQQDSQGVYAYEYQLLPLYHSNFGNKAFEATLYTTLTAL